MTFYNVERIYIYLQNAYTTSSSYEHASPNLAGIFPLISKELEQIQNKADHIQYLMYRLHQKYIAEILYRPH